jgi:hypothetical protein
MHLLYILSIFTCIYAHVCMNSLYITHMLPTGEHPSTLGVHPCIHNLGILTTGILGLSLELSECVKVCPGSVGMLLVDPSGSELYVYIACIYTHII